MANPEIVKKQRPKRKGRPRPLPPDVTARNLAIEKQRREALNENFLELARMLPNLASARRLTKVLIVNASVEHVRQQRTLSLAAAQDMQDVFEENHRLTLEVNALRAQVGGPDMPLAQAKPMTEAMVQLAETKNQVFGTFNAGFGDNRADHASQPQLETSNDVYGVVTSVDNSYAGPDQPSAVSFPLEETQTHIESLAPVPLPVLANTESQANPGPYMGGLTEPASMSILDLFEPGDPYLHEQLLMGMSTHSIVDATPTSWFTGVDMNETPSLLHDGEGNVQNVYK